jgi:hypothetical protein
VEASAQEQQSQEVPGEELPRQVLALVQEQTQQDYMHAKLLQAKQSAERIIFLKWIS